MSTISPAVSEVRKDFIHKDSYLSKDFAELEQQRLWPQVWQWACRLEEIPLVGDYVVYDVAGQSVIVVRTPESEIKAFQNACPYCCHRLLSGSGHITKFYCAFHSLQWSLDGDNTRVLDQTQLQSYLDMASGDMKLSAVHVEQWAGFVFINMAENPEPFAEFMEPAMDALNPLAMDKMRYCWRILIDVNANWKVAQEAFMESYHVWGTHPQLLPFIDEKNFSEAKGKHGRHFYANELPPGVPSRRLDKPDMTLDEMREGFSKFIGALGQQVGNANWDGQMTRRSVDAAQQTLAEMPSGTTTDEYMGAAVMAMQAAAEEDGAYFPLLTEEEHAKMGEDWNVFPTMSLVPSFDGTLIFRALPRDDDPNKCTLEMISLLHWGKGKEPKVERQHLSDWRSQNKGVVPPLLLQDLINMEDVQKGMHSIAFKGARPNPVQEIQVSHFHKVIGDYLFSD